MSTRFVRLLLPLLLLPLQAVGQSTREAILSDPAKAGGLMYVYDYKAETPLSPAPKGYKPFYFSHFGRHGARYVLRMQYDTVAAVLGRGAKAGLLSDRGKQLFNDYQKYYSEVRYMEGELSGIGIEQEQTIAKRFYRRYPEIFKGPTRGTAFSTPSARVVLSMTSFIDGLQSFDRDLNIEARNGEAYSVFLRPNFSTLDRRRPVPTDKLEKSYIPYFMETVDTDGILGRIFTDPSAVVERCHIDVPVFIRHFAAIYSEHACIDNPSDIFSDLLTLEDRIAIARADGFRIFNFLAKFEGSGSLFPDFAAYSLKDIIEKADADIASGQMQIRLRFTHDSAVIPLLAFMNINGLGVSAKTPEEAFEIFPFYKIPMGASLQIVFFRKRSSQDILVKLMLNEEEAVLPFPAFKGPFYRWSDFKDYYGPMIQETIARLETLPPRSTLLDRYGLAAETPM
ncbi:MAG: hypothetical protein J6T02_05845 [Bacteroidales bacterium]|nr:hypothetical protein [Bacteroidales bacterium]